MTRVDPISIWVMPVPFWNYTLVPLYTTPPSSCSKMIWNSNVSICLQNWPYYLVHTNVHMFNNLKITTGHPVTGQGHWSDNPAEVFSRERAERLSGIAIHSLVGDKKSLPTSKMPIRMILGTEKHVHALSMHTHTTLTPLPKVSFPPSATGLPVLIQGKHSSVPKKRVWPRNQISSISTLLWSHSSWVP